MKYSPCDVRQSGLTWGIIFYEDGVDKIDWRVACCCGCSVDQVEASDSGGSVCCSRLRRLTILAAVCSVARSVPALRTCRHRNNCNENAVHNPGINQSY